MWDIEMPLILRHIIDDLDEEAPKYSDERLQQLVLVAGQLAQTENVFPTYYVCDIENVSLTPDPTDAPRDDPFINLSILKAACLLAGSKMLGSSFQALAVREEGYSFDARGVFTGQQATQKTWCQAYNDAKWEFISNNRATVGEAIIGPYRTYINRIPTGFFDYYNNRINRCSI